MGGMNKMFISLKSGAMLNLFWLQDCFQGKHDKNIVIFYMINGSKITEEYETESEATARVEEVQFAMNEASVEDTRPIIVNELPTENISYRRTYLVPISEDPEDGYQEWKYIQVGEDEYKWEMSGITKSYAYSKEEVDKILKNYYTSTQVDKSQQAQDEAIQQNATNISSNAAAISQNATNIATNSGNISSLTSEVSTINGSITSINSNISTLSTDITTLETGISTIDETVTELASSKQDTLNFDLSPTQGSENPVTSDGIYNAIADSGTQIYKTTDRLNKIANSSTTITDMNIIPNTTVFDIKIGSYIYDIEGTIGKVEGINEHNGGVNVTTITSEGTMIRDYYDIPINEQIYIGDIVIVNNILYKAITTFSCDGSFITDINNFEQLGKIEASQVDYTPNDTSWSVDDVYGALNDLRTTVLNKTDYILDGTDGRSEIFNEANGGGARFTNIDNTVSFVGVNSGGSAGITGQLYSKDSTTNIGTRLNMTNNGFYYTTNKADTTYATEDEIATKKDINSLSARIKALEEILNPSSETIS